MTKQSKRGSIRALFVTTPERPAPFGAIVASYLAAVAVIVGLMWASLAALQLTFDFSWLPAMSSRVVDGFVLTLQISAVSLACSLVAGVLVAVGLSCRVLVVRAVCNVYVTIMRGTPLIMQVYLFFYVIGTAWGISDRFAAGVLILTLFEAAYIAEIVRGSLSSLDETQLEAARACGLTRAQTLRHVIVPQMMTRTLPALTSQFATIIKDSSLLSVIAVIELTQTMREISATNFRLFECYLLLGGLYLCMTLPLMLVSKLLERRFDYARRS